MQVPPVDNNSNEITMPREISEADEQDLTFLHVGNFVRSHVKPEQLKDFIKFLRDYIPKEINK